MGFTLPGMMLLPGSLSVIELAESGARSRTEESYVVRNLQQ